MACPVDFINWRHRGVREHSFFSLHQQVCLNNLISTTHKGMETETGIIALSSIKRIFFLWETLPISCFFLYGGRAQYCLPYFTFNYAFSEKMKPVMDYFFLHANQLSPVPPKVFIFSYPIPQPMCVLHLTHAGLLLLHQVSHSALLASDPDLYAVFSHA